MITFYFHPTPNPMKVALYLEESGLAYTVVPIDTLKGDQHGAEFLAVNPNAKLPAIVDDGVRVFDSNAILLYLAEKTGQYLGAPGDRGELLSWLMFVATGLGPFSGQAVHFQRMAPVKPEYAVNRYRREAERLYGVLDAHLAGRDFIVGDSYTIADMAAWGWIDRHAIVLDAEALERYRNLKHWFAGINARPAVARARAVGIDHTFKKDFDEVAQRALFPQNFAPH